MSGAALTDSARRRIFALRQEYRASELTTLAADRYTTERIITRFYAHVGRPAPQFRWFNGPLSCMLAYNVIERIDDAHTRVRLRGLCMDRVIKEQLRNPLRLRLASATRSQLGDDLCRALGTKHWIWLESEDQDHEGSQPEIDEDMLVMTEGVAVRVEPRCPFDSVIGGEVAREIRLQREEGLLGLSLDRLWSDARAELGLPPSREIPTLAKLPIPGAIWGGEGQAWVSHHRACEYAGANFDAGSREQLAAWDELNHACGWWFPCERMVLCAERHLQIRLDDGNRFHGEHGPAIECRDGLKLYRWHGTRVPAEWVERREVLDPAIALTWKNIEQRRAAAEIIGWARVLERIQTRVIDADRDPMVGTLLECELPDAGRSRFLRVRCGTGREFVLSVPLEVTTARSANAWTYGLSEDVYQLEART